MRVAESMAETALIVPGRSVGLIDLGMSVKDVEALLGAADERYGIEEERTVYLAYLRHGLSIRFVGETVEAVLAYSGRAGGYETWSWSRFKGAFACGLDFDTRAEDVIRLLGPPEHSGSLTGAPIPSIWTAYSSRGVGFDFIEATGEMIYITIFTPRETANDEAYA